MVDGRGGRKGDAQWFLGQSIIHAAAAAVSSGALRSWRCFHR